MTLPDTFCFVDIETTGASLKGDRIIDIGIVKVVNNKIVKTFNSLIDPGSYIPPEITRLTGITSQELTSAPTFTQIKDEIFEILSDSVFVAHNVDFDYRFLKAEFKRRGVKFSAKRLCTVRLSRFLYPQFTHHNLDAVIERFGLKCDNRHRGLGDAQVLWEFVKKVKLEKPLEDIQKAFEIQLKRPNIPLLIKPTLLKNLPESPGVYMFYSDKTPLYIGKSKNIKKRVYSHFSSSNITSVGLKLASQTNHIKFVETAGELEALLRESHLIKTLQPLYNRMLRHSKQLVVLKIIKNKDSYFEIKPEVLDQINPDETNQILGVYRSLRQAKDFLTRKGAEFNLCDKLLNLEKTKRTCFGYMLGRCKGACNAKENFLSYNIRVQEAFQRKFKPWPFSGPIMIEEESLEDKKTIHFVDKWCYLGCMQDDEDKKEKELLSDLTFDVDTYKILYNFVMSPQNQKYIKQVSKPEFLQVEESSPSLDY